MIAIDNDDDDEDCLPEFVYSFAKQTPSSSEASRLDKVEAKLEGLERR